MSAMVGSTPYQRGQLFWQDKFYRNPSYQKQKGSVRQRESDREGDNDIGLLRVKNPIKYGTWIYPAILAYEDDQFPVNTECFMSEYGTRWLDSMNHTVIKIELPSFCTNRRSIKEINPDKQICTTGLDQKYLAVIKDYSGTGLLCPRKRDGAYVIAGVLSYEYKRSYAVFTRVPFFRPWIDSIMAGGKACPTNCIL